MANISDITSTITADNIPVENLPRRTFSGVVSACVCSTCVVIIIVFSTVPAFASHSPVVWGLEAILTTIGGIFTYILWVFVHKNGEQTLKRNTKDVTIRMKLLFLWLFGIVNIINSAINMAINCDCLAINARDQFPGESIVSIATHVFEIIFNTGQLGLISSYASYRLKSSTLLNYGISTIILTHLIRWFRTIFTSLISNKLIGINSNMSAFLNDCYWNSDLTSFRRSIVPWIEPTLTEYSLLAVSLMLRMWISFEDKSETISNLPSEDERAPLLHHTSLHNANSSPEISTTENSLRHVLRNSSIYICVLLAVILCLPMLTTVIMVSVVSTYSYHYQVSTAIVQCLFKVELLAIILLAYYFCYKQYEEQNKVDRFKSSRFILILCTAGSIAYSTFGLIAGFMATKEDVYVVASALVVQKIFEIVCIYLQTVLILQSSSFNTIRMINFSKGIPLYKIYCVLFSINITMWLLNSYARKDSDRIMSVERDFYGKNYWKAVNDVMYPITIFYRFHTAMDIYQLYKKYETLHTMHDEEA